jgi:hypothetical protein
VRSINANGPSSNKLTRKCFKKFALHCTKLNWAWMRSLPLLLNVSPFKKFLGSTWVASNFGVCWAVSRTFQERKSQHFDWIRGICRPGDVICLMFTPHYNIIMITITIIPLSLLFYHLIVSAIIVITTLCAFMAFINILKLHYLNSAFFNNWIIVHRHLVVTSSSTLYEMYVLFQLNLHFQLDLVTSYSDIKTFRHFSSCICIC